ncbi:MAG: hypothetical protein K2X77_30445 [Candidatus Obscuribacterales bacterium]|nr:hypothetical protein [Candidatus Obscuribacterales bacterium]
MQTCYLPICAVFTLCLFLMAPVSAQQDFGNGQYSGGNAGSQPSPPYPAYGSGHPQSFGNQPQQFGGAPQFGNQQQQINPQFGGQPNITSGQGMLQPAYPSYGNQQQPMNTGAQGLQGQKKPSAQQAAQVFHWFVQYDEIRRRAQMNPIERQQADGLLARGFSLFMPGQDKVAAKQLLTNLVNKYHGATQAMKALPVVPETKQLQIAYYQYFENAMNLFSDYLRVQDNIFAVDATGQSIAKQLLQRKLALEALEHNCKNLDTQMRQHFGVAAYQY